MIKHKYESRTGRFEKCGSVGELLYTFPFEDMFDIGDDYYRLFEFPDGVEVDYGPVKETYYSFILSQKIRNNDAKVEIEEYISLELAKLYFDRLEDRLYKHD